MMLYSLPCLLEEDTCRFRTIKLEFSKAKEILELHMKYVHERLELRNNCDSSERDTNKGDGKEITEDDMKAICDNEDSQQGDTAEVTSATDDHEKDQKHFEATTAERNSTTENEDSNPTNIADVTLVIDDRDKDQKHFEENVAVEEIFKPVVDEAFTESVPSCRNCGSPDHTSQRKVRKRHCSAWNQYCKICHKRGHIEALCNVTENPTEAGHLHLGEIAALQYCLSKVSKEIQQVNKVKIPHLLHNQLEQWIVSKPKTPPNLRLSVRVDTQSYRDLSIRPPSAFKHRVADLLALADTGCQATCIGPLQLSKLGLSKDDLMDVEMRLSGANSSSLRIFGALFVNISGESTLGKGYLTKQLCYVAEGVDKMLLSREACEQLGIIDRRFPSIGSSDVDTSRSKMAQVNQYPSEGVNSEQFDLEPCSPDSEGACSCPRREDVPPPPKFDPNLSTSQLRKLLITHYKASAFNRCTRQTLPLMGGEPLPIPTRSDVKPVAVHTPVAIPLHWEEKVYKDLMRDVALGVIEPVPINTPVTWCSRMVVVPKHSGEPRRTVDLQALNRASVRQTHHTRSPFMLASAVPAGKKKSVLDVWNSFHSVPIRMEDRDKTTFITPWGRFRYKVAPQGYLASMDGYTHRFSLITENIKNKQVIVDDTIIWSDDVEQNFKDVSNLLETGHKAGLIFNADKFQFGQDVVDFAGLEISRDGVRPCKKFIESIRNFPRPGNLSEARSFFGMINQVSYSFSMSAILEPFRHLLKPETWTASCFSWTPELEKTFQLAKEEIIHSVTEGVKHFDVNRWTCLATDWSRQGIGFFLMQKWCSCSNLHPKCCKDGWKLVLAGGRFTRPAESRYSPVEGEMLGVMEGLHKAKHFILGCEKLIVAVDHKPLLGLLNDKSLADIDNPRLLMLKEKTLWFNFKVVWVPGRTNAGPDFMSRVKNQETETTKQARINCILGFSMNNEEAICEELQIHEVDIIDSIVASLSSFDAITFDKVKNEVAKDEEMTKLVDAITKDLDCFPDTLAAYNKLKDSLSVVDGVPMYGRRVIVPKSLRREVLEVLHSAHQCPVKMNDRAKHSVYWSGITSDIENMRRACSYCNRNSPSQAMMPPMPLASPEFPHQMIVGDYFDVKGKTWLVLADRFSGWLSLHYFPREATATDLVRNMKDYFTHFGIAEHFSSDSGPQFQSSLFQNFLRSWGVEHRTSSSYFPKSNLRSETAVKSAKRIVMDNSKLDGSPDWDRIRRALLQHRNTPDSEFGLSPAQLVYGRPMRDFLPIRPGEFSPAEVWVDCREKRELAMRSRIIRGAERWSEHTRDLPPLAIGTRVLIQNQYGAGKIAKKWDKSGMILEDMGFNKYRVKVDGSGRITQRNRQFLKKFTPVTPSLPGPSPNSGYYEPQENPAIPSRSQIYQPVANPSPTPEIGFDNPTAPSSPPHPTPGSPTPPAFQSREPPNTPESPTFVTPPSSPGMTPNLPDPVGEQPPLPAYETPTLPRRSTRISRPPDRWGYSQFK